MVIRIIILIVICSIIGGCINFTSYTYTLSKQDVIPKKYNSFKNKKFNSKNYFNKIDTSMFYKQISTKYSNGNLTEKSNGEFTPLLQFYSNGNIRLINNRKRIDNLKIYNPDYTGIRGIIYSKYNKYYIDMFVALSPNRYGFDKSEINFNGDTIVMVDRGVLPYEKVMIYFIKSYKIPIDTLRKYKANW